jgi:hypothetical protein
MANSPPKRGQSPKHSIRLALAACALSACSLLGQPGPTAVSQSRYFQTGNVEYDRFFTELYQTQHRVTESPAELSHARATLVRRLGLDGGAGAPEIGDTLALEAERLAQSGVYVSLVIDSFLDGDKPTARHELTVSGTPAARNDEKLLAEVRSVAMTLAELHVALVASAQGMPGLAAQRFELDRKLETVPSDSLRVPKDAVRRNLTDAEDALPPLRGHAFQVIGECATLIDALERGFDTLRKKPPEAQTPTAAPATPAVRAPVPKSDPARPRTDAFQP